MSWLLFITLCARESLIVSVCIHFKLFSIINHIFVFMSLKTRHVYDVTRGIICPHSWVVVKNFCVCFLLFSAQLGFTLKSKALFGLWERKRYNLLWKSEQKGVLIGNVDVNTLEK